MPDGIWETKPDEKLKLDENSVRKNRMNAFSLRNLL
jgi:hypothetical protein